jgi:hypothetical protein
MKDVLRMWNMSQSGARQNRCESATVMSKLKSIHAGVV